MTATVPTPRRPWWRHLVGPLVSLLVLEVLVRAALWVPSVRERVIRETNWDRAAELGWAYTHAAGLLTHGDEEGGVAIGVDADPLLGWVPVPGSPEIDAHGCRDEGLPRASDATRLVVVGDSFGFGLDAPIDVIYTRLLEERHPDLDVHNLAMWGYDHAQMALRWERDGVPLHPQAVLLLGVSPDIPRDTFTFFAYAKPYGRLDDDGAYTIAGTPVPSPAAVMARVFLRPRTYDLLAVVLERRAAFLDMDDRWAEGARLAGPALDRWAASVQASGALPILVAVPVPGDLTENQGRFSEAARAFYAGWCAGRDFPCVERWDAFRARSDDPVALTSKGHWSALGHEIVAELVDEVLVDAGVVSPTTPADAPKPAPRPGAP